MTERELEWIFDKQDLGSYTFIRRVTIYTLESWDTSHRCLKTINKKTQKNCFQRNILCDALDYSIYHIVHMSVFPMGQTHLIRTLLDAYLNYPDPNTAFGT